MVVKAARVKGSIIIFIIFFFINIDKVFNLCLHGLMILFTEFYRTLRNRTKSHG